MTWGSWSKEALAAGTGSVLGFVQADVPGAYQGARAAIAATRLASGAYHYKPSYDDWLGLEYNGTLVADTEFPQEKEYPISPMAHGLKRKRTSQGRYVKSKRRKSIKRPTRHARKKTRRVPHRVGRSNRVSAPSRSVSGLTTRQALMVKHPNKKVDYKKKRTIHVPKLLRKQIKKIEEGGKLRGTYIATYYGHIGIEGFREPDYSIGDLIGQVSNFPGTDNYKTVWFRPLSWINGTPPTFYEKGNDFWFFNALRVLNAASVLWNNKGPGPDYSVIANSLTTSVDASSQPSANIDGVKIHVRKSWVNFLLRNNSQRTLRVEAYTFASKLKFTLNSPGTDWVDSVVQDLQSQVYKGYGLTPDLAGAFAAVTDPFNDPRMSQKFTSSWNTEKNIMVIEPGQTCEHTLHGPSDFTYDYAKMYEGNQEKLGGVQKMDRFCAFSLLPDLMDTTSGKDGNIVPFAAQNSGTRNLVEPISMRITTHYQMEVPEIAGFIKPVVPTASSGIGQPLNERKRVISTNNFGVAFSSDTSDNYIRIDEENPPDVITNS